MTDEDGMTLVYVPEGEFLMGSTDANSLTQAMEKPQHTVLVDAFWIDQTEVTNKQFRECLTAGICHQPIFDLFPVTNSYLNDSEFDNYPAIFVSWDDAKAYCEWIGRRVPTEAEWGKAARGTDGQIFPWGNDEPNDNLLIYNRFKDTPVAVKSYPDGVSPFHINEGGGIYNTTSFKQHPVQRKTIATLLMIWLLLCRSH